MLRHGWVMHGSRFGGRRRRIGDGNDLEDADILSRMQAKRLWEVVVDGYPQFGAARKCGNSGHKCRQSVFQTEVDVLIKAKGYGRGLTVQSLQGCLQFGAAERG